jgi:hypothetical protein
MSRRDRTTTPATEGNPRGTPGVDLVVLCRDAGPASSLFRISFDGGAHASLLAQGVDLRAIRTGDVNGDGVDDVVALQGDSGSQSLVAYRQCTSREAESCRLETASAEAASTAASGGAP